MVSSTLSDDSAEGSASLASRIDVLWEQRASLTPEGAPAEAHRLVQSVLEGLDTGRYRVAEKRPEGWVVHQWLKKAVLLSFRLQASCLVPGGPHGGAWWDKVPSKFAHWEEAQFQAANFRVVPGALVRRGAYIGPQAVLMPCFVNLGAHVGQGSMVDTWSTVGSCAQIGARVHLSGGVGIGGVLEPLQASPVIIEDDCFIGARSEIVEGVLVERGSVLAMGVYIGATTRIVDRATGRIFYGRVPAGSVVVPGSMPSSGPSSGSGAAGSGLNLYCAVIVKTVDAQTRSKTSINELLRY